MTVPTASDGEIEKRLTSRLLDVLIRAGLLLAMVILCYRVFAPFLTLTVWAVILAVTLYPLHQLITRRLNGRQALSATLLTLLGIALLVVPMAVLMSSTGDAVQDFIKSVQNDTLEIPPPSHSVAAWPLVGQKLYDTWSRAYADLPGLVQSLQPKVGELARTALGYVASIAGALLGFLAALILAGVILAFGEAGARACQAVFTRIAGKERGTELVALSAATIRAVAQGVVGVALIQAILIGLCLIVAGVPWPGALAAIMLVLGIAQVPALIITIPAIVYVWTRGDHSSSVAIAYTVLLLVAGMADNVLKPLMLGRGVNVPMPVVLVGALGGMAALGIAGMFVGAALLAIAYQVILGWVAEQ
jgi:predicted PurR-regulated permease PerM